MWGLKKHHKNVLKSKINILRTIPSIIKSYDARKAIFWGQKKYKKAFSNQSFIHMSLRKAQFIWTGGMLEKHSTIKNLDINSNSKYTEVIQPSWKENTFLWSERKEIKNLKLKI